MALKSYTKTYKTSTFAEDYITITPLDSAAPAKRVTMWDILSGMYSSLKNLVATSNAAGLVIPATFVFAGLTLVYLQYQPTIIQEVKNADGFYDQGNTPLVQESYVASNMQYVSNPGSNYFKNLTEAAFRDMFAPDIESQSFSGTLFLTIPSLGFNRLPVRANVNSGDKQVYDTVLNTSLAHFKGTSLPMASNPHNIVFYGHSAGGSYNPTPEDVLAAFTFLPDLQIGDMIIVEADGKEYKYQMIQTKVVKPDDTSIITGTPGKETLTLFTCFPPGNYSQRFVAVAQPV